jgi:hypothetical protein
MFTVELESGVSRPYGPRYGWKIEAGVLLISYIEPDCENQLITFVEAFAPGEWKRVY